MLGFVRGGICWFAFGAAWRCRGVAPRVERAADRVAAIGDACAAAGHAVSAREAYLRASNCYRTSCRLLYGAPTAPERVRAFERESARFPEFAVRADPALEPVSIPYEGTT